MKKRTRLDPLFSRGDLLLASAAVAAALALVHFASFVVPNFSKSLFAEKARKESLRFGVVFVALAALTLRHALKGLFDVLAAASPGWFATLAAGYL